MCRASAWAHGSGQMEPRRLHGGATVAALLAGLAVLAVAGSAVGSTGSRSRAGAWIAVEGGGELAVVDAWSGARRQVAVLVESEAAWSRDHHALAYVADGALRVSVLATGRQRQVTRLGGKFSIGPSWSKRRGRLAFAQHGVLSDNASVVVVSSDGRHRRVVDRAAASYQVPQWSPDGRRIAYLRNAGNESEIWVTPAEGGGRRVLERHVLGYPESLSWSPDGRHVAFVGSPAGDVTGAAVLVANANGSRRRAITAVTPQLDDPTLGFVKWAPTGTQVAFLRWAADGSGSASLCVAGLRGGERVLVPEAPISDFAWSPDGRLLAYVAADASTLWILRTDGSQRHKVARLFDDVESIAWG
jgi:Tol biopolymer transport system component